jgi:DNA end-binding protein Ku
VEDHGVHFHELEKRTHARIKQHMVNSETGDPVPKEEIRKGYEIEKGTFVLLDEDELHRFEPKPSRDIEILQFVSPEAIDPQWYERPYYVGPDGDAETYFALVEALRKRNKEGIVRWVMRKKEYSGALGVHQDYLVVTALRPAEEMLSSRELSVRATKPATAAELRMAEQLVDVLRGEFRPEDFEDEYRDRVLKFIEAKAKGRKPRLKTVRTKRATGNLMDQLSKSLKTLQKEKKVA